MPPAEDVLFDWRETRRHDEATSLLEGYEGLLQSDGYRAYPNYAQDRDEVVWLGCWSHTWRKFFEAQAESPKAVRVILKLIAAMYRLESFWEETTVEPTERARLRAKHMGPAVGQQMPYHHSALRADRHTAKLLLVSAQQHARDYSTINYTRESVQDQLATCPDPSGSSSTATTSRSSWRQHS